MQRGAFFARPFLCSSKERVAPRKDARAIQAWQAGQPEGSANSPCGLKHAEPYIRLNPLASTGLQWRLKN